ncbi:MAG: regulatory protein RecX [Magnetospirillum sp.]|nr:regulatory protein RecX [Magnetospirillum sp.]
MTNRRPPPKISASYLENAALHYLERYSSSRANLRRVLLRKVDRSLAYWGGEHEEMAALVDAAIARLAAIGYLDDAAYAETKVRSLHRRGKSTRLIAASLAAKGVGAETVQAALGTLDEGADLVAALALARKRRLGPFRPAGYRAELRNKDMAVLGRAGFSFEIVRRVIEAEDAESLADDALGLG